MLHLVVSKHSFFSNKVDLSQERSVVILRKKAMLKFGFVIFWQKHIGSKAAQKTLMKLTTG